MRKLLLACIMSAFLAPAFAGIDEGIDPGMVHISVLGGLSIPTTSYKDSIQVGSSDMGRIDYGDVGGAYGVQIMYHLIPALGLGFEFNGANYSDYESSITIGPSKIDTKWSADKYQYMFVGKVSISPKSKTRVYIPFGIGLASFKSQVKSELRNYGVLADSATETQKTTKLAGFAGLGFESDLNDIFVFGAEARYNMFQVDKDKFLNTKNLSNVDILLKLGVKF